MNEDNIISNPSQKPDFCDGIEYFAKDLPQFDELASKAIISSDESKVSDAKSSEAVYQTLLGADVLRYLTLHITGSKGSGHPGGFASSADLHSSLIMLGHTNIVTEVGHHAPGFYSSMFLDTSLEDMGIKTVNDVCTRFRERDGLLGHLSGAVPGLLSPAGPLGQGQHFAMSGALLNPDKLFPVTIGDGGMGEPYILSSMMHFHTAFPKTTNFLPSLIWNGYSQEHHSMVSEMTNEQMIAYWKAHGFEEVVLVDAKDFDDSNQEGAYVDSTRFSFEKRLEFTASVLAQVDKASKLAMSGTFTAFIIKQLKGSGVHALGAKSHNLYPTDSLEVPHIMDGLKRRAVPVKAWEIVRENFQRAGGGAASKTVVTESVRELKDLSNVKKEEFEIGSKSVPSTAMGAMVAQVGKIDENYIVTNADGNEASAMKNINDALKIRHPQTDPLYNQEPNGQCYEPLNEDACAGLAAGLSLFGSRAIWLSYESFAINGWPIVQTVSQAMAELRRKTPSTVSMFTAGALEQGRNGWTHQRPEIENFFAAMMRNGNAFALFPCDANAIQVAYDYATNSFNKTMVIIASKTPLPVYLSLEESKKAMEIGAGVLYESDKSDKKLVVFAVTGDMVLLPVFEAKDKLENDGYRVRIVSMVNPRQLYRAKDVAWESVSEPDNNFMDDKTFDDMFGGDMLIAVSGGASGSLEPVLLRTKVAKRDVFAWQRGETTASHTELMDFNNIKADSIFECVKDMDK